MGFSKEFYLGSLASVYLVAFSSLYIQLPGLYGDHGLLPVKNVVQREPNTFADFLQQPSLVRFRYKYSMDTESAMDLVCLSGIVLSFLATISSAFRSTLSFSLMWVLYMSLYAVGQTFLWFQWDILLLEAGFLGIIIAPLGLFGLPTKHHHDRISMFLVKWLLFRLMYASGVVKLQSGCDTWWGLTALDWHFESQCIPTPFAWYFHHTPQWFKMFSNASVFVIQIAITFLFFAPNRALRMFSFYAQVSLQILILLTGNYNFFNLLTMILCVSLVDDDDLKTVSRRNRRRSWFITIQSYLSTALTLLVFLVLGYYSHKYFQFSISENKIYSKINFTRKGFDVYVHYATWASIYLAAAALGLEILKALYSAMRREKGVLSITYSITSTALMSGVVIYMFCISLIPHTTVDHDIRRQIPDVIHGLHADYDNLQLVSSYGLFRSMTGVGGRPEVVVMGSNDKQKWKEYEFLYKPGSLNRNPPVVAPHQPRLDWQMWFAALGYYNQNHWFIVMLYRLLDNEPTVLNLIQKNPFPDRPPKYIKAQLFTYHYSGLSARRNWWIRDNNPNEYTPILSKDEPTLVKYLSERQILPVRDRYKPYGKLDASLRTIRSAVGSVDHALFVFALYFVAVANALMGRLISAY